MWLKIYISVLSSNEDERSEVKRQRKKHGWHYVWMSTGDFCNIAQRIVYVIYTRCIYTAMTLDGPMQKSARLTIYTILIVGSLLLYITLTLSISILWILNRKKDLRTYLIDCIAYVDAVLVSLLRQYKWLNGKKNRENLDDFFFRTKKKLVWISINVESTKCHPISFEMINSTQMFPCLELELRALNRLRVVPKVILAEVTENIEA